MFYLIHFTRIMINMVRVNKLITRKAIEQIIYAFNSFLLWDLFIESEGNRHTLSKKQIHPELISSFCSRIKHQNPQKSNNKLQNRRNYNPNNSLLSLLKLLKDSLTCIPVIRINYPLPQSKSLVKHRYYQERKVVCYQFRLSHLMMSQIRKISKQVSSFYPQDIKGLTKQISKNILDRHLHQESPCLDAIERFAYKIIPYWSISWTMVKKNISGIVEANWAFDFITENKPTVPDKNLTVSIMRDINDQTIAGKNISIYLVFWLPITTMLLANILHNNPEQQSRFGVLGLGFVMLGSMLLISYALYVYSNVMASPYNLFFQHLCPSSYIALLDFVYAIICAASPEVVLIPMTILYAIAASGLHFRLYNQALKPTLLQLVALFFVVAVLHISSAYLYYINFSSFSQAKPTIIKSEHNFVRHFNDTIF